jgi:hypothetical protein|tara:strand:+ start:654 stop:947 length:294 start_codon:yes stop_codon:yes gene_type:complete
MIEIIFLILLSAGNVYFIWRALSLANSVADQEEYIEELEDMSQYMYDQIKNAHNEMKKIDHKGAFESDDEAGTTFEFLKNVIINLEDEFNAEKKKEK